MFKKLCLMLGIIICGTFLRADVPSESQSKSMAQMITPMQKIPGYFNLYWDPKAGKLWLEISRWDQEFLFVESLPNGVGSNDIGLDRGQIGGSRIVRFTRVGPKVLLMESNYGFRADTQDPMERRSVEESFALSVLWGFNVVSEDGGSAL
ncbi:MAG TPA: peptidase, partial [Acidobacteriota bacterium]|nr:peptidase [Acidobacteriota bacterium]